MAIINHVAVVVPARNEEEYLPRSLAGIGRAVDELLGTAPQLTASVTVVLDRCTDRSADLAGGWPGVCTLEVTAGNAGSARAAGVSLAMAQYRGRPGSLWLANTDADSVVPPHWLTAQLSYARAGMDMVVGTVMPDPSELSAAALTHWRRRHRLEYGHPHVHGANLGLKADVYLRAGGYRALAAGEDVDLVARVKELTSRWVATDRGRVVTSGRTTSRTTGGFAGYLANLPAAVPQLAVRTAAAPSEECCRAV